MKKVVTILGARPQFVKAAVLSRIINEYNEIEEVIIHTGQHFDQNMSEVFFTEMNIPRSKYNLQINSLSHGAMTGQMLEEIEKILLLEKPDSIIVYGDTNSTIAGALSAKKLGIKVIHIEAGLRSFNMKMPEEVNRILTDRISDLLLCPTDGAVHNLENESYDKLDCKVVKSGDIMKDAVEYYGKLSPSKSSIINDLGLDKEEFVLATIHRQENTDSIEKLESVFKGLEEISKDKKVVLPLHPRTKKMLDIYNINPKIKMIEPIGYFDMLELLKNCNIVVTDSGGLQKEAFFCRKHCIVVREETEWTELVDNDFAKIVGSNIDRMINAYHDFQKYNINFDIDLYGENVGQKIYKEIYSLIN